MKKKLIAAGLTGLLMMFSACGKVIEAPNLGMGVIASPAKEKNAESATSILVDPITARKDVTTLYETTSKKEVDAVEQPEAKQENLPPTTEASSSATNNDTLVSDLPAQTVTSTPTNIVSKTEDAESVSTSQSPTPTAAASTPAVEPSAIEKQPQVSTIVQQQGDEHVPVHTHNWTPIYEHHDEVGHYEDVVVSEAYDEPVYEEQPVYEEVPVYEHVMVSYCSVCGEELESSTVLGHLFACNASAQNRWADKQVGTEVVQVGVNRVQTNVIHHDAIIEQVYVIDSEAYDSIAYYQCSICGETKQG